MKRSCQLFLTIGFLIAFAGFLQPRAALAQGQQAPGRPIGNITTQGDLIILELDEGVIAPANLFDLGQRTLRFTPEKSGYRVENMPVQWDPEFGPQLTSPQVTLRNFQFPYSGKSWDTFSVGQFGTISFSTDPGGGGTAPGGRGGGRGVGPSVGRFEELRVAGPRLVNTSPFISVFLKPRLSGPRYAKELADRVVITWNLTEPVGGIFDFTWVPTVNRFQAVLRRDGWVDLSYDQVAAQDAIIGVYPLVTTGAERPLATVAGAEDASIPAHLDIRNVKASVVDGLFLKITFETRGPVLPEGDPQLAGVTYRVYFDVDRPFATGMDSADADVVWTIRGSAGQGRGGGGGTPTYVASGPGVSPGVKISGNTISLMGALPAAFKGVDQFALYADVTGPGTPPAPVDQVLPRVVTLSGLQSPAADLSAVTRRDGPFPIVYEAFHHAGLPRTADMAATVIRALGDRFDFFVWYSDFRIDNQEAGTPSTGPRGGNVTGTGQRAGRPENYGSAGQLQWMYVQPVPIVSNQGQERSPDGKMTGYNYAMSQVAHELAHRWTADATAKIGDETLALGPTHWGRGLQAPAAFPYRRTVEASLMGGGVWQDNFDGTYSQLDDDFYVPATGWSPLDLYLMGLAAPSEVPDFFFLKNLARAGTDAKGHPLYKGDRVKVTIDDVIASLGPRLPDYEHSQKNFNTGVVGIVLHGRTPSRELIERANGIREAWIDFWSTTTGRRSIMTTSPR
jgi:hypothetical protein